MRLADANGLLAEFFSPSLTPDEWAVANFEGLILGIR
jgi:hypothetical protein